METDQAHSRRPSAGRWRIRPPPEFRAPWLAR